jgi:putative transposase
MRKRRIKVIDERAVYHCITRVVGGQFLLQDSQCKEVLRKQLHQVAQFCGVEILTYCIMSNHAHILVRVPSPDELACLSDADLLQRCRVLYRNNEANQSLLETRLNSTNEEIRQQSREQLIARMGDVSAFMKELKQRFSIWYNRTHNRFGTLWAERFKSVLVENTRASLMMVAAYIDLNPVRAGIVTDPKDYRYCGYSEMLANGGMKNSGLGETFRRSGYSNTQAIEEYRKLLFGAGAYGKTSDSPRIDPDTVQSVMQNGGKLSQSELLRHRVRYFSDGAILGSRTFVQERFRCLDPALSTRRSSYMPLIPYQGNEELAVFRNLRKQAIF